MACDFNNWDYWTPWSADTDSTAVMETIGNCELGALLRWDGEEMGKGEMMLTEIDPLKMLKWELTFEGYSEAMLIGMTFTNKADSILVTWTADGDLGYWPPGSAFCIFFRFTPASQGDEIRPPVR